MSKPFPATYSASGHASPIQAAWLLVLLLKQPDKQEVAKGTEVTITYRRSDRRECNLELADASPLTPPSSSSNDGKIELQHVNVDRITCDLRVNATAEPAVTRIATF